MHCKKGMIVPSQQNTLYILHILTYYDMLYIYIFFYDLLLYCLYYLKNFDYKINSLTHLRLLRLMFHSYGNQ